MTSPLQLIDNLNDAPRMVSSQARRLRDEVLHESFATQADARPEAVAIVFGLILAITLEISRWSRRAVYPLLVISQTIPIIALAPLLLIWFGIDLGPKVFVVALYCFFPIAVACADGLADAEPELINLLKSMHASRWQILWLVRLPGAMPSFFSGLRIAATYGVTGAIFGEYVGAYQGLGIYMQLSVNSHAIVLVFAAILVTAVLSLLLFGLVSLIERIALPWYHGTVIERKLS